MADWKTWVCLPLQSTAEPFLPCTHSAECIGLKISPTAAKQTNKNKSEQNQEHFVNALYIFCFALFNYLLYSALSLHP